MPLETLLRTASGTCRHCGQKADIITRDHPACNHTFEAGWKQMIQLAAKAAKSHNFDEKALRLSLADIANRSYGTGTTINHALEEGWKQGVGHAMADGVITQTEETNLHQFRDRLALDHSQADPDAAAQLGQAATNRLTLDARLAAVAVTDTNSHLQKLSQAIKNAGLTPGEKNDLLVTAWETAVEAALEDGLLTLDEENALNRYMTHFNLNQMNQMNRNGVLTQVVKSAVLRDIQTGVVPQRQHLTNPVPFNLMKSEKLVWTMHDAEYYEVTTRRERRGTSHGLSIRVTRGVYYRPGVFRSKNVEWDENVHADTGLLGFTTKHIYFSGPKKRFRVRYDKIVGFEPFEDGFSITKDAQNAKPQSFRTGDGWFAYNLAASLSKM